LGIPLSLEYKAEWDESKALLSISLIFQLMAFPERVFCCFFMTARICRRERGSGAIFIKFEFDSREA